MTDCTKCHKANDNMPRKLCIRCTTCRHLSGLRTRARQTLKIDLTDDQLNLLYTLKKFIKSSSPSLNERIFVISSAGGTGKTQVITMLNSSKALYLAPTHKACIVLADRLKSRNCETLHRFLAGEPYYDEYGVQKWDFNTHSPSFKKRVDKLKILIIDEGSMVGYDIYKEIIEVLTTYPHLNLIVSGDEAQLPPVVPNIRQEIECEVKAQPPFYLYHAINYSLIENVRNENPEYNELLAALRTLIISRDFSKESSNHIKSLLNETTYRLKNTLKSVETYSSLKEDDIIMLAHRTKHTNNVVGKLNTMIRHIKFNNPKEDFVIGERIQFTDFMRIGDKKYYTCSIETVVDVDKQIVNYYQGSVECYILRLSSDEIIRMPTNDSMDEFKRQDKLYKSHIKKRVEAHIRNNTKAHISEEWNEYYTNRKSVKAPIEYRYALSIHKSQGSSYNFVFINISDFSWMLFKSEQLIEQYYKLLYVCLSRSRTNSVVF